MATLYASVNTIRSEAARLDPVKVFITLFLIPFYVVGWTARIVWVAFSLAWTGMVVGWRTASTQINARQTAAASTGG